VKKNGQIWYPASVVGYHRSIDFAYDFATRTLFANGVETLLESVVVDDIVYVNMTPKVTAGSMHPGMDLLASKREELKAMESVSPHLDGRTDALFMSQNGPDHAHPWSEYPGEPQGPIIDLDPTSEAAMAPHMRPGARPPARPPEALPNRLPRPGEVQASSGTSEPVVQVVAPTGPSEPTVAVSPSGAVPLSVTTEGGPSEPTERPEVSGLIPIPDAPKAPVNDDPFRASGSLQPASAENSVYKVHLASGTWQVNPSDRILRVKLQQQNQSRVAQSNLGSFTVRCADGTRVEASRTRSYLPDGTLDPGTSREGDLVFRFEPKQAPKLLELEGALKLSVPLQMK